MLLEKALRQINAMEHCLWWVLTCFDCSFDTLGFNRPNGRFHKATTEEETSQQDQIGGSRRSCSCSCKRWCRAQGEIGRSLQTFRWGGRGLAAKGDSLLFKCFFRPVGRPGSCLGRVLCKKRGVNLNVVGRICAGWCDRLALGLCGQLFFLGGGFSKVTN